MRDTSFIHIPRSGRVAATIHARLARLAFPLLVTACSALTDVHAPDVVQVGALDNPAGADAFRAGAISDFALVFGGSERGLVTTSGAIADEFYSAASPTVFLQIADQRIAPDPGTPYPYADVQRARNDAARAIDAMHRFQPAAHAKTGELFALKAYTELFLGENMCSGIPVGQIIDRQPVYGTPLGTSELFALAMADFDSAAVLAADSMRILSLARVGRGRALLDAGRFADAASAVSAVATSFTYATSHSAAVQPNGVFAVIVNSRYITVADREGANGLDFRSANDPRVPTTFVAKGIDGVTDVYNFTRYSSLGSPIVLASGIEARLIEAEASLQTGDSSGALAILNSLRATTPGLAPLPMEPTDSARVDQLFRERAFWLFATGHRQGDLRRLVRQYGRDVEAVFPTGPYKAGQTYGVEVTFAPDALQLVNPAYTGCASRAP